MNHHASPDFWTCYRALPASVRELADKSFGLLKADPRFPSLHLKKVGRCALGCITVPSRWTHPTGYSGFGLVPTPSMTSSSANNAPPTFHVRPTGPMVLTGKPDVLDWAHMTNG